MGERVLVQNGHGPKDQENKRTREGKRERTREDAREREKQRTGHPPGKKRRGREKTTHQRGGEGLRQKEQPAQKPNKPNKADRHGTVQL